MNLDDYSINARDIACQTIKNVREHKKTALLWKIKFIDSSRSGRNDSSALAFDWNHAFGEHIPFTAEASHRVLGLAPPELNCTRTPRILLLIIIVVVEDKLEKERNPKGNLKLFRFVCVCVRQAKTKGKRARTTYGHGNERKETVKDEGTRRETKNQ